MIIINQQELVIFVIIIISNAKVIEIQWWKYKPIRREYLNKIKLYMRDRIIDLQKSGPWKVQLTRVTNFISSKYIDGECVMHSKGQA